MAGFPYGASTMTDREKFASLVIQKMKDQAPQFTFWKSDDNPKGMSAVLLRFHLYDRVGDEAPMSNWLNIVASGTEISAVRNMEAFAQAKVEKALAVYARERPADAIELTDDEAKRIILETADAA